MKKHNALMRASGILLVLTLGTSCFVGGTFAKYVTEKQGEDSARVAKWGVNVSVKEGVEDLFEGSDGKDYVSGNLVGDTVVSSTSMDVFAPGTEGTLGETSITGVPEVAVKVDTDATVVVENWDDVEDSNFYCPLIFTITQTNAEGTQKEEKVIGLSYDNNGGGASSFKTELERTIEKAYSGEFEANTDLSEQFNNFSISWEWPFAGEGEDANYGGANWTSQEGQTNVKDTALGDRAAKALSSGNEDSAPRISITLKTTVTQID